MSFDSDWGSLATAAFVLRKADAVESLREIRISECVGAETFTIYSPAGSCVLPATKSKGILTVIGSCACATRVVAIAVSAIMPAITKARVFMGHSFFLFRWRRPRFTLFCSVPLPCQRLNMVATFAHSFTGHNARGVNW